MKKMVFILAAITFHISPNQTSSIVNPLELLTTHKFSTMAKYIYAKQLDLGVQSSWGEEIYYRHLYVWNQCNGDPGKHNINDYINSFKNTLASLKTSGFDPEKSIVPLGNITLVDGEHRLAGSLLYHLPMHIKSVPHSGHIADFNFFQRQGLERKYLDAMALQYAQLKRDCKIAIVNQSNNNKIESSIKKMGSIVYKKNITLTTIGIKNINFLYLNPSKFTINKSFTVYLLDSSYKNQEKIKSIYVTSKYNKVIQLSQIFFNTNSLYFLNHGRMAYLDIMDQIIIHIKKWALEKKIDLNLLSFLSNASYTVYGEKNYKEFDFVVWPHQTYSIKLSEDEKFEIKEKHNNLINAKDSSEIIFNPKFHFFFKGVKFINLN